MVRLVTLVLLVSMSLPIACSTDTAVDSGSSEGGAGGASAGGAGGRLSIDGTGKGGAAAGGALASGAPGAGGGGDVAAGAGGAALPGGAPGVEVGGAAGAAGTPEAGSAGAGGTAASLCTLPNGAPVTCTTPPPCHLAQGASCDAETGECVYPYLVAGAICGDADVCTCEPSPALIVTEPSDVSVLSGTPAVFTVVAAGVPAPTYQWQECLGSGPSCDSVTDLAGQTSATFSLSAPTLADSGRRFVVVVQNAGATLTSRPASLSVRPHPLTGFDQIASGYAFTLLLKGGQVYSMGNNESGELGREPYPGRDKVPTLVVGLPGPVKKIVARGETAYALLSDSTVWAWGNNSSGQLGNPSVSLSGSSKAPLPVLRESDGLALSGIVDLVVSDGGSEGGAPTAIAWTESGAAWVWGSNYVEPNTPDGSSGVTHLKAVQNGYFDGSTAQRSIKRLALSYNAGMAIVGDDSAVYWWRVGAANGTLVQTVPNTSAPILDVAATMYLNWFISSDNQVFQYPSSTVYTPPALVDFTFPVDWIYAGSALGDVSFAHDKVTGVIRAWGMNSHGELGDGTVGGSARGPAEAVSVGFIIDAGQGASGAGFALALRSGGAVWGWGTNEWGALGTTGDSTNAPTPYQLTGP
jgi:hypothetical protein